ncbi:MAG: S1 RNA-binding domain-containing protein [Sedimentisphaerales bacterium]|nr:S1 RNA-binding domain-containing protein [Sedimentisphaerales bacterium]
MLLARGTKVEAKVVRIFASGIVVELEDGRRGLIRSRELSWGRGSDSIAANLAVGDEILAVVLEGDEATAAVELSLKQVSGDPWQKVRDGCYHQDSTHMGEVVNLEHYGAFVELEPGVTGLVHRSEIPGGTERDVSDLLWIGDQVEVKIVNIDLQRRRIGLSIVQRLRDRHNTPSIGPRGAAASERHWQFVTGDDEFDDVKLPAVSGLKLARRIRRVFVVDDDAEFATDFASWLSRLGYVVSVAVTGQEALSNRSDYQLLFLDVDLPDTDGTQLVQSFLEQNPKLAIVLITGREWLMEDVQLPKGVTVSEILLKPLEYSEVLKVLSAAERGELAPIAPSISTRQRHTPDLLNEMLKDLGPTQDLAVILSKTLHHLRGEVGAGMAILFAYDTLTQQVELRAFDGFQVTERDQEIVQRLRFSVVRDVAVQGEQLIEGAATSSRRFDTLLVLQSFESCIGVPFSVTGSNERYALFLLDPDLDRFKVEHFSTLCATAQAMSGLIHQSRMQSQLSQAQTYILVGELSSSLMHEIRNKLNRIEQQARLLELDNQQLLEGSPTVSAAVISNTLERRVNRVLETNAQLRELTLHYLGLMGHDDPEEVDVNTIVLQAVRQISAALVEAKIKVDLDLEPRLPKTYAIEPRLRQVFLNVLLNALQLMENQPGSGGFLRVKSSYDIVDRKNPIKVRITDEGPGLHRKLWEWAFQMGTSTRKGGTGLGLFVSRGLMQSMGGALDIEKSYMFVGSTFVISLPMMMQEATNA